MVKIKHFENKNIYIIKYKIIEKLFFIKMINIKIFFL